MFQSNQAFKQLLTATGGETSIFYGYGWLFGSILAIIVGIVIIGGIRGIARVTEKVVPFMGGIYCLAALVIILINYQMLPYAINSIFTKAFTPEDGRIVLGEPVLRRNWIDRAAFTRSALHLEYVRNYFYH